MKEAQQVLIKLECASVLSWLDTVRYVKAIKEEKEPLMTKILVLA